jgi:hypothetical protein
VISDGSVTSKLDASGHVVAQIARGGRVGVDAGGNVVIASNAGGTLTVEALGPDLTSRWVTTGTVPPDTRVTAVAFDAAGGPTIGMLSAEADRADAWHYSATGQYLTGTSVAGEAIALAADDEIVAWNDRNGTLWVFKLDRNGSTIWGRSFAGSAWPEALAAMPDGGAVMGAELSAPMDFGGGTIPTYFHQETAPDNGVVVRLDGAGNHVFSQRTEHAYIYGLATNGQRIAVSDVEWTQLRYPHLTVLQLDGTAAPDAPVFDTSLGNFGDGGEVAIAGDGRIWWNLVSRWPVQPGFPYLLAL